MKTEKKAVKKAKKTARKEMKEEKKEETKQRRSEEIIVPFPLPQLTSWGLFSLGVKI